MTRKKPPSSLPPGKPPPQKTPHIVASIDLHGYKKSEAISRLTEFLDQITRKFSSSNTQNDNRPCWVEVITGSGAHSNDGPVLRPAVQALLERRQMTWKMKGSGKACFLINANSGKVFYEPGQPQDTKLIISDASNFHHKHDLGSGRWSSATTILGRAGSTTTGASSEVEGINEALRLSTKALKKEYNKKKKETRAIERAVSMSRVEAKRAEEKEEQVLKRVVSLSILDSKQELEDEECFQRVIEMSKQDVVENNEEDAELQEAIELSRLEQHESSERAVVSDDDLLQQVIALSQQEYEREKANVDAILGEVEEGGTKEMHEDESDLLRALKQSVVDF